MEEKKGEIEGCVGIKGEEGKRICMEWLVGLMRRKDIWKFRILGIKKRKD